jgi:hypothetical protein
MYISGGSTSNGAGVLQYQATGLNQQIFTVTNNGANCSIKPKHVTNGSLHYGSTANGTTAVMALNSSDPYKFTISKNSRGYYRILGKNAGEQGLVVRSNSKADAAYVEMRATNTTPGSTSAEWQFVSAETKKNVDEGTYFLRNKRSNMYMDVYNGGTSDGSNIIQHAFNGSASEQFRLTHVGGGYYSLCGVRATNKYVMSSGNSVGSAAMLYGKQSNGTFRPSQLFRLEDTGRGSYRLIPKSSNLELILGISSGSELTSHAVVKAQKYDRNYYRDDWILEKLTYTGGAKSFRPMKYNLHYNQNPSKTYVLGQNVNCIGYALGIDMSLPLAWTNRASDSAEVLASKIIPAMQTTFGRNCRKLNGKDDLIGPNEYKVALRVHHGNSNPNSSEHDYHMMIQTSDGKWAQKQGQYNARIVNAINPTTINWTLPTASNSSWDVIAEKTYYTYNNNQTVYLAITLPKY